MPSDQQIIDELRRVKTGATCCAGMLARRLGTTQRLLRPTLCRLEREAKIEIRQRGAIQKLHNLRGPYRVSLPTVQRRDPNYSEL